MARFRDLLAATPAARVGGSLAGDSALAHAAGPWRLRAAILTLVVYVALLAGGVLAMASAGDEGLTLGAWSRSLGGVVIADVLPNGPAARAGLEPGDVVLEFDGVKVSPDPTFHLASRRRAGETTTLLVRRVSPATDWSVEEVTLTLRSRLARPGVVFELLTYGVVGLLTLGVALTVALARPNDPAARILLVGGVSLALTLVIITIVWSLGHRWLWQLFFITFTVSCVALLHLFLVFPAPHPFLVRLRSFGSRADRPDSGGEILLYVVPLGVTLAILLGPSARWTWTYFLAIGLLVAALLALRRSFVRPPTPLARAQIKWVLWALAVGVLALVLGLFLPIVSRGRIRVISDTVMVGAWIFFPIALGIAILRYRLFEVNLVLRAALVYPLITAALVVGYLALAFAAGGLAAAFRVEGEALDPAISVVAALAVAALAHPARLRLQGVLDRVIYRDRVARRHLLREAVDEFGHAQPPDAVAAFLTQRTVDRLDLSGAWLALAPGIATVNSLAHPGLPLTERLVDRLQDVGEPVVLIPRDDLAATAGASLTIDDPAVWPWYDLGARVLVPLRPRAGRGGRAEAVDAARGGTNDRGELIGVWALGARRSGEPFDREDLDAFARVGHQAAVLLDYARLSHEQIWQELTRHELAQAREIQERLLPHRLDGWPGRLEIAARFRPALETSGDFYDVVPLTPPTVTGSAAPAWPTPLQIAVGDVAGKGIPAALIMAVARTTLRAVARRALQSPARAGGPLAASGTTLATQVAAPALPTPAGTLGLTGGSLYRDVGRKDFVACALAIVEPLVHGTRLRLANAAQVPPLLCRDGQAAELVPPGERLPLGVLADPAYEELVVDLAPGDVVVFASDGLPEAPAQPVVEPAGQPGQTDGTSDDGGSEPGPAPGELFGFERLAASSARWATVGRDAEAVAAGIWSDLAAWCGEASQHDDMTLVVLRVPTAG